MLRYLPIFPYLRFIKTKSIGGWREADRTENVTTICDMSQQLLTMFRQTTTLQSYDIILPLLIVIKPF